MEVRLESFMLVVSSASALSFEVGSGTVRYNTTSKDSRIELRVCKIARCQSSSAAKLQRAWRSECKHEVYACINIKL